MVSSAPSSSSSAESVERAQLRELYVQKKGHNHASHALTQVIQHELGIQGVTAEIYDKYYIRGDKNRGLTDGEYEGARNAILTELPLENSGDVYSFIYKVLIGTHEIIDIADVPGQFSARTNAVEMSLLAQTGRDFSGKVKSNHVIVLRGDVTPEQRQRIHDWVINPVEKVEQKAGDPIFPAAEKSPERHKIMDGFIRLGPHEISAYAKKESIAIDLDDMLAIQTYFREVEKRDPTYTELKLIETYWSDHCRHTTFHTAIQSVQISGDAPQIVQDIQKSQKMFEDTLKEGAEMTLMNLAQAGFKALKDDPKFQKHRKLYDSEENNAASYVTKIVNELGEEEEWVIMFKNETHNSPTETEPFGGAATCIGGCIRDPLSGGTYTFQAMRITGSGDPTVPVSETMAGKLSQKFISLVSALGYSSYGNQIGLATGMVREFFHPGYRAKHLELGYVVAAAPIGHNKRSKPKKGDIVLMIGGRTGRDGVGGATVSSKEQGAHEDKAKMGAHVQKGNAPEERKLQRLFLNPAFAGKIIKCNDFGAGGVAVAVGEVARGLNIDLDTVRKKYEGLDDTELAISESQERMAVVISPEDYEEVMALIVAENLEHVQIATITDDEENPECDYLKMNWKGNLVVDISRDFLDSMGAKKVQEKAIIRANGTDFFQKEPEELQKFNDANEKFLANLARLGVACQKGMGSKFDSSVGASTILAPFGGKYQSSPQIGMAAKIPSLHNKDGLDFKTATISTFGGSPHLADESTYLAGMYAVIDALSRTVAMGGDIEKVWLTAQEYFGKLGKDDARWGEVYAILLGFFRAQKEIKVAAIGGKDSGSGTFKKSDGDAMHVPTTLIAMTNSPQDSEKIVSAEFQDGGHDVVYFPFPRDDSGLPDWEKYGIILHTVAELHAKKYVMSSSVVEEGGMAATVAKMCFGNKIGFCFRTNSLSYTQDMGGIILEVNNQYPGISPEGVGRVIGSTTWGYRIQTAEKICGDDKEDELNISLEAAQNAWEHTFDSVHSTELSGGPVEAIPPHIPENPEQRPIILGPDRRVVSSDARNAVNIITKKPKVVIPVFPGTNSELDTKHALHKAGFTDVEVFVFQTKTPEELIASFERFAKLIGEAHMVVLPGGFSGADEPGGSAKFANVILRSPRVRDAINAFLQKSDTLTLGICNGFQMLMKLGVFENGEISDFQTASDMTLAHNTNGRHMTDIVGLKVTSILSPFCNTIDIGDTFIVPISHSEGGMKFSSKEQFLNLLAKGQIVLQTLDAEGNPTNEYNGSDYGVAGICSPDGRIFGLMPHPERSGLNVFKNVPGNKHLGLFDGAAAAYGIQPK